MTDPTEAMRDVSSAAALLSGLPGVDEESMARQGANKMRKTLSEALAAVSDDHTQVEIYEQMKDMERKVIQDNEIDTDGLPDGQVRMRCQIVLVERLMEKTQ